MAVHQIERLDEYVRYLQKSPADVDALFRDLLIGVTSFFRDAQAFGALQQQVPRLLARKPAGATIRVWVPGCSTGEEAYSLAILLQEQIAETKENFNLHVFATDIDHRAIETARASIYPAGIAADISPERLDRFFTREPDGNSFRIQKSIRDRLVFSEQDVIKDPPFSKLDLISCRNLLIYMGGELQKKLIPLFHYALNPGGMLFLGTSETVGEFPDLFAPLDRKLKLYQRREGVGGAQRPVAFRLPMESGPVSRPRGKALGENKLPVREITERALLELCAPGALVNEHGQIYYLHGRTGKYLEPSPGEAGMNILQMAREGLRRDLTSALHKATTLREPISSAGLRVKTNGDFTTVNLTVRPVSAGRDGEITARLFLVVFEDAPTADPGQSAKAESVDAGGEAAESVLDVDERVAKLKKELRDKEEYLQSTNEELATSNEELKSSNEEMQSVNEELQSTNEELETSKEELQSVNEELATVNGELQNKVADLSRSNNDMNNLLAGTGIGTVFVDYQLRIQRFTPAVTQVINLIPTDVGRPVGHIVSNMVGYDRLVEDVRAVLDTLVPREVEVETHEGACYLLRIRPYRTQENVIEGAVITFTDTTEMKKVREALRESEGMRRLAVVVRDAHDAITVQDLEGRILAWNPGAERMYGWSEAEALAMNVRDLIPEERREEALAVLHRQIHAEVMTPYLMPRIAKGGLTVEVWLTATALVDGSGAVYAIATTERKLPAKP
jgi:two-component system CheB/CheR fusion protein